MLWFMLLHVFSTVVECLCLRRLAEGDKDLEILILRHQLAIAERQLHKPLHISRVEKLTLAVLTTKFKATTRRTLRQLGETFRLFQPETVLKWHRELVRRKWTFKVKRPSGRPCLNKDVEMLIVRLARENSDWGYGKLQGELLKLGYTVSQETIRTVLKRHGLPPAFQRGRSIGWRHLMQHYKEQLLACDFFVIETLCLRTLYVLFFIELGTRRVHVAGCTAQPTSVWVTQQARQLVWNLDQCTPPLRFLIHDNDGKFAPNFDAVFASEGVTVIHTPLHAPNANAYAERWVRSVRQECLDKLLILNQTHLQRVLRDYVAYYNDQRPHQGLAQRTPIPRAPDLEGGRVCRRDVLGGIIHDYYRAA